MKQDVDYSSFHLFTYHDCIITVYFLLWYTYVARNLIKVVVFEVGLSKYSRSGTAEVRKFSTLSWHSQRELKTKNFSN